MWVYVGDHCTLCAIITIDVLKWVFIMHVRNGHAYIRCKIKSYVAQLRYRNSIYKVLKQRGCCADVQYSCWKLISRRRGRVCTPPQCRAGGWKNSLGQLSENFDKHCTSAQQPCCCGILRNFISIAQLCNKLLNLHST